ncbi:MAG: hypothetical protein KGI50_04905 [Patescibacteria group bacterium]|nr:hypothetical protein [Patescibacteria group bacterium]MDE2438622.1 hypothetical protein [Patescibacteria group bacterium]
MNELKMPYIGVTGVMKREESSYLSRLIPRDGCRQLMVGVLASLNTLRGKGHNRSNRYPLSCAMADIFFGTHSSWPPTLNLIHYATNEPDTLYDQLVEVDRQGGWCCDGVQLNMVWPQASVLEAYRMRNSWAERTIVLQVGAGAFRAIHSPKELVQKIHEYEGIIDYVLLDLSGGLEKSLDENCLRPYLEALYGASLALRVGVAGGLGPDTLHLVEPLLVAFPDLSIDAESKLRNSDDCLDIVRAEEYVKQGMVLCNHCAVQ